MDENVFFGLNPGDRVMVAYSGGVDSSYAAEMCRNAGFAVETVTMLLFPEAETTCRIAAERAALAGFPHHVLDLSAEFREEIMHRTWLEYSAGRTPNPCALCNPLFKFGRLREFALSRGCRAMVTGHYARIVQMPDSSVRIEKARCLEKDQSYFLFGVPREALAYCRTPLGNLEKSRVRELADACSLPSAKDHDSQDICFGGDSLPETLSALFPQDPPRPGRFVSPAGEKLGEHRGIQFYTIGQRKGTGVALGCPAYISSIRGDSCEICITKNSDDLLSKEILCTGLHLLQTLPETFSCMVRIRYRSKAVPAHVTQLPDGLCRIVFDSPVRAAAPGQAAVFYHESVLLGGAWIQQKKEFFS